MIYILAFYPTYVYSCSTCVLRRVCVPAGIENFPLQDTNLQEEHLQDYNIYNSISCHGQHQKIDACTMSIDFATNTNINYQVDILYNDKCLDKFAESVISR